MKKANSEGLAFKEPNKEDLLALRKAIESGDVDGVRRRVWENPRYLIGTAETPMVLQEGCRYNALHVCALRNRAEVCSLILETIADVSFIRLMYPDVDNSYLWKRSEFLTDRYLNTPDKGNNEAPLHFACKFGHVEMVALLSRHPKVDKFLRNKYDEQPKDMVCARVSKAAAGLKEKIHLILEGEYFVRLLRSDDNDARIALPWSHSQGVPEDDVSDNFQMVGTLEHRGLSTSRRGMFFDSPMKVPMSVKACAGPMPRAQADMFRLLWTASPRTAGLSREDIIKYKQMLRSDVAKGLECIGRKLCSTMDVPWTEYWPFLDAFVDIRSADGLRRLEDHLIKQNEVVEAEVKLKEEQDLIEQELLRKTKMTVTKDEAELEWDVERREHTNDGYLGQEHEHPRCRDSKSIGFVGDDEINACSVKDNGVTSVSEVIKSDGLSVGDLGENSLPVNNYLTENNVPITVLLENTLPITELPENSLTFTGLLENNLSITGVPENTCPVADLSGNILLESELPENTLSMTGLVESSLPITDLPLTCSPENVLPVTQIPQSSLTVTDFPHNSLAANNLPITSLPENSLVLAGCAESNLPVAGIPQNTLPLIGLPENTLPLTGFPHSILPLIGLPENTLPLTGIPENTLPLIGLPENTLPLTGLPENTLPLTGLPENTLPLTCLPENTLPLTDLPENPLPVTGLPENNIPLASFPENSLSLTRLPENELPKNGEPVKSSSKSSGSFPLNYFISKLFSLFTNKEHSSLPAIRSQEEDPSVSATGHSDKRNSSIDATADNVKAEDSCGESECVESVDNNSKQLFEGNEDIEKLHTEQNEVVDKGDCVDEENMDEGDDNDSYKTADDDLDMEYAETTSDMNAYWPDWPANIVFINGSQPSRYDLDVFRALDDLEISMVANPRVYTWRNLIQSFPEDVRCRWSARQRRGVKRKLLSSPSNGEIHSREVCLEDVERSQGLMNGGAECKRMKMGNE